MRREKVLRLIYSLVAFAGSVMLNNIRHGFVVFAQDESRGVQAEQRRYWDRHDEKEYQIDQHLSHTDSKLSDVAEKVSMICGVGATAVAGLGILNLLGFLKPHPAGSEPPGKTHFITPE